MEYRYTFSYMKCESCTAKIHCTECGEEVTRAIMCRGDIEKIAIDMKAKQVVIVTDLQDEDEILDRLDEQGVMA